MSGRSYKVTHPYPKDLLSKAPNSDYVHPLGRMREPPCSSSCHADASCAYRASGRQARLSSDQRHSRQLPRARGGPLGRRPEPGL